MSDLEKAVRILEQNYRSFVLRSKDELISVTDIIALLKAQGQKCQECGEKTSKAIQELQAKLKAQEPKTVIGVVEIYKDIWLGNCPSCDQSIVTNVNKQTKYCRFCGQAVRWGD